jgi:FkbM family methyltransferase
MTLAALFRQSLAGFAWRSLREWDFEHRVLPRLTDFELHGVTLDLRGVSSRMKSHIVSGRYESAETELCRIFMRGDEILELGAAIGFVGLYCLRTLGAARVVCVEPNPVTATMLRANYRLNGFEPVVVDAALAPGPGVVKMEVSTDFWTDALAGIGRTPSTAAIAVRGLSFDGILAEAGGGFTAMLVDVEGAEQYIDWSAVPESVQRVVLELHPEGTGTAAAYEVLRRALERGFVVAAVQGTSFALRRA